MATSVNIPDELEDSIENLIEYGDFSSKGDVIRTSLREYVRNNQPLELRSLITEEPDSKSWYFTKSQLGLGGATFYQQQFTYEEAFIGSMRRSSRNTMEWEEFRGFLDLLKDLWGADLSTLDFTIGQMRGFWFGSGVSNFLKALDFQDQRYNEYPESLKEHDTEEFSAIIKSDIGDIHLSGSQRVRTNHTTKHLSDIEIGIRSQGMPVHMNKIREVGEIGDFSIDGFRPLLNERISDTLSVIGEAPEDWSNDAYLMTGENVLSRDIEVDVVEEITRNPDEIDEEYVEDVIIRNPFYEDEEFYNEIFDNSYFSDLTKVEKLRCKLVSGYRESEKVKIKLRAIYLNNTEYLARGSRLNIYARGQVEYMD